MLTVLCYMVGVIGIVRVWQASVQLELFFSPGDRKKEHWGLYISYKVVTIFGVAALVMLTLIVWTIATNLTQSV